MRVRLPDHPMSYLVLARKWRPKRFAELVGQEHVVRALTNALDSGRVHHAFLFTGTRGVGKTTIARIFAKSLNCESGTSAEPCGACNACLDIDAGRFVDLLEIDAASNTGVDDVRALIENAQYMPARGRTKVYLIDEVHMLSRNAFNALLKTLEEPPGHVKFLLATTDPQKLPVTVLSRCLQFNLRRLEPAQIEGQLTRILQAEGIAFEAEAIALLAHGADGSLRDGLSLLDQAIAYTGGSVTAAGVQAMLGTVDRGRIEALLAALGAGDGAALMTAVDELAQYSPDFAQVLDSVADALHKVQLRQLVPAFAKEPAPAELVSLAAAVSPELVQVWYQLAVTGRRDLGLAPSTRAGFEMALLRMLAFRPAGGSGQGAAAPAPSAAQGSGRASSAPTSAASTPRVESRPVPAAEPPRAFAAPASSPEPARSTPPPAPTNTQNTPHALADAEDWLSLQSVLALRGPVRELAAHTAFLGYADGVLRLALAPGSDHLRSDSLVRMLSERLGTGLGAPPQIRFEAAPAAGADTLHDRTQRQRSERQSGAEAAFVADPVVSRLLEQGATLVPDSIRPLSEN
jgi:DNA polymerase-3 subunit gamma/tau